MKRSRSAQFWEKVARRVVIPKGRNMTEVILAVRKARGKKQYSLPFLLKIQDKVDDVIANDMQLFYMNVESESDELIIYLHGGAYVEEILPLHWLMLDRITSRVNSTFIIPDYPLAPHADFKECYKKMTAFYQKVLEYYPDRKIILMGDSAGGGLAAGLALYFHELGLKDPDQLILLSPWVDLVMDNPEIADYIDVDPTLKYDELCVDAAHWANGTDLKDPRLSPIYGDLSVLKDVTLFTGTHEFFYPDIMKFGNLLKEKGVKTRIYVGEGLDHVYPVFPIPEAEEAIQTICRIIEEKE